MDNRIDDRTFCNQVERGNFRLHPKGLRGISKGCIVIDNPAHFHSLRRTLKGIVPKPIAGTHYAAYGKVVVK